MAWGWSKIRYSPIAVDFGADSLKLLQIIPSDPPQMVVAAAIELPEHARIDPASRHAFFQDALKDLVRSNDFKGRRAICSMPSYQTLVQHLQINRTDNENEFITQVNQQLMQRLNVDPSRMVVRHFRVGQVMRDGGTKQEVICLAASREAAMSYVELARAARLDVVGMHSEPLAILRAFGHLYRRESDAQRVTCFIDLGSATTKVIIAHGIEMAFAKTIHFAGDHFTRQAAQRSGLSFSEARLKRMQSVGSPALTEAEATETRPATAGGESPQTGDMAGSSQQAAPAEVAVEAPPSNERGAADPPFRPGQNNHNDHGDAMDCLIDELRLCVRYHQSTFTDKPIEKLVFLGGESRHVSVCQKIAKTLRIGAQLGDPIARLVRVSHGKGSGGVDMRQPQPGWAVPMGLCLSEANL